MTKKGFYPQLEEAVRKFKTLEAPKDQRDRQCFHCVYYKPLDWPEGSDYGVCLNPGGANFGFVVFEHFGCESFGYPKLEKMNHGQELWLAANELLENVRNNEGATMVYVPVWYVMRLKKAVR